MPRSPAITSLRPPAAASRLVWAAITATLPSAARSTSSLAVPPSVSAARVGKIGGWWVRTASQPASRASPSTSSRSSRATSTRRAGWLWRPTSRPTLSHSSASDEGARRSMAARSWATSIAPIVVAARRSGRASASRKAAWAALPAEHEAHQLDARRPAGRAGLAHRRDRDARDLVDVPAVDPGPDGRHRHGGGAQTGGDLERAREAGGEQRRVGLAGAPVRRRPCARPTAPEAPPRRWRPRRPRRARRRASCAAARGMPSSSAGPAAAWIAPSTPPPPSSDGLAAFTIASTACAVMSPSTASSRTQAAAAAAAFSARCAGTWA